MLRLPAPPLAAALLLGSLLLAACGGGTPTLPPVPPDATNRPSAPPASVALTPVPSAVAPVSPAPPTPIGGQGAQVVIKALNIDFEPKLITVTANEPFQLGLDNQDSGVPHDIQVMDSSGNLLVKSEIITGPAQEVVEVPPLAPGRYTFSCAVHPNMTGTITSQ